MKDLIEILKNEHKKMIDELAKAQIIGISTPLGQKILADVENFMLKHMDLEEKELYPAVYQATKGNPEAYQEIRDFYEEGMKSAEEIRSFFDQCSFPYESEKLEENFKSLFSLLSRRILLEELKLFEVYSRHYSQQETVQP